MKLGRAAALLSFCVAAGASFGNVVSAADFEPETIGVTTLPADLQRIYLVDAALNHMVDGRVYVLDAHDLSMRGMMEMSFAGMFYAPTKDKIYVASTFYERLTRGKRTDVVQVYDPKTLSVVDEIPVSATRAQALNYRPLFQGSIDGKWLFLQNATPATSIEVVDLATRKTAEIPNPGCYGIYPALSDPLRFATLCGDGRVGSYTLNPQDGTAARKSSARIFDAAADPLFSHAEHDANSYLFLSFKGTLRRVSMEGETAAQIESAAINADVPGNWRPGGFQPFALLSGSQVVFVLMHPDGAEGSHKNPSAEIWAYDLRAHKLLARSPAPRIVSLTIVPSSGAPVLVGIDQIEGRVVKFTADPAAGYALKETAATKIGETAYQVEVSK